MNTYFVKHGLVAQDRKVPGRYAYHVTGSALYRNGASFMRQPFTGHVYGDGYEHADGSASPASNIDPHVLSDVIPWFMSFCFIDKDDEKRRVAPEKRRILPDEVNPGDIIVFGNAHWKDVIFVDTVICVHNCPTIPQSNGWLDVEKYHRDNWNSLGLPESWEDFKKTRSYVYNLSDAAGPHGRHRHANDLDPYKQIVGRSLKTNELATIEKSAILARFLDGQGFNFIPLREKYDISPKANVNSDRTQQIVKRRPLFTTTIQDFSSEVEHYVSRLSPTASHDLIEAILRDADKLVLDRIDPAKPLPPPDRSGH